MLGGLVLFWMAFVCIALITAVVGFTICLFLSIRAFIRRKYRRGWLYLALAIFVVEMPYACVCHVLGGMRSNSQEVEDAASKNH